jgi:arylsulfatase A-like enzyme
MTKELLAGLLALLASACSDAAPRPRNLLIVCVDTLRADELGAYGRAPSITPALDRLAAESAVFERAHVAASWTLPSMGALFTSLYPSTTGLWTFENRLSEAFPTLAERFRAAGFATHGVASHVFFDARHGLQQGFETFDDELCHRKGEPGWRPITSPEVSRRAAAWIEARAEDPDEPWLLFAHFFDPHLDYLDHEAARPDDMTRGERERYQSEIAFTDRHVGAVLAALAESGQADDTAVLFFSDHGEAFLEHPPIRRHSYGLYEEELRVPLLLRVPGVAPRRVEEFVRTVDLLPTLLELFGLDDPDAGLREGISLVPELLGRARVAPRPPQLAEIRLKDGYHADALVRAPYKLYHDVSNDRVRLYDLAEDPAELRDLASERPELAAELRAELDAVRAAAAAKGARFEPGARVEHTPEELRHLQELGYAGDEEPGAPR